MFHTSASQWAFLMVALLSAPVTILGCTCSRSTQQQAICKAEWISHVLLRSNSTVEENEHWVAYQVEHLQKFKMPTGGGNETGVNGLDDDTVIRTPAQSFVCGVTNLEGGKEYLLAGTIAKAGNATTNSNNNSTSEGGEGHSMVLSTTTCLEIPLVDGKLNEHPGVIEWVQVAPELLKKLGEVASGKFKCQS